MPPLTQTFERCEKKYIIDVKTRDALIEDMKDIMIPDAYGKSTIMNIYYDTEDYTLIRQSIEKPPYKEKLRLRSYGVPKEDSRVFIELKKKCKGVVFKRREVTTMNVAREYLDNGRDIGMPDTQIKKELDWFLKTHNITNKVFIAYDRTAFFQKDDPGFRITYDTNIRWRGHDVDLAKGADGEPLCPSDMVVMEVKVLGSIPLWLVERMSRFKIYPGSFSKYGTCYRDHLIKDFLGEYVNNE